ncbi:hypothetical protein J6590_070978 [Homalodisca vitripennis]|nr:hypothetical protein J6590_070978 [Homalodisca vitripennis]
MLTAVEVTAAVCEVEVTGRGGLLTNTVLLRNRDRGSLNQDSPVNVKRMDEERNCSGK